ncbi:MAG TPA: ABC transporter permease, partial [Longimicrobiales bacterium]|nr:ABC transporter permease [Longimicrobiales bacterium]
LVTVSSNAPGLGYEQFPLSPDVYFFYRSQSSSFQDMGIFKGNEVSLTGDAEPERVPGAAVSPSLFTTLQVQAGLGRSFTEEDDLPDAEPVVVLGHDLWMRRYGGDPGVLGTTAMVNGEARRIVGVMPERFTFPGRASVWIPTGFDPADPPTGTFSWSVVGRLAPEVSAEQAQAQLVPLVRRIMEVNSEAEQYYNFLENGRYAPLVHSLKEDAVGSIEEPLWILLGTVGFVLLIACANVANLVLIRADGRQRETAVRAALGAGRGALLRLHLAETVVLAGAAGVAGVVVAWAGVAGLLRFAPPQLPRIAEIGVDIPVLLCAAATTALSALLFGVAPALRYTRPSVLATLRTGARGSTA